MDSGIGTVGGTGHSATPRRASSAEQPDSPGHASTVQHPPTAAATQCGQVTPSTPEFSEANPRALTRRGFACNATSPVNKAAAMPYNEKRTIRDTRMHEQQSEIRSGFGDNSKTCSDALIWDSDMFVSLGPGNDMRGDVEVRTLYAVVS